MNTIKYVYVGSKVVDFNRYPGDGEMGGTAPLTDMVHDTDIRYYRVDNGQLIPLSYSEIEVITTAEKIKNTIATYENALQDAMDKVAGEWGYGCPPGSPGSIGYAIGTYLNSTNAQWKADATALHEWLESVWTWAAQQQTIILADTTKLPKTAEFFVAAMPAAPAKPVI